MIQEKNFGIKIRENSYLHGDIGVTNLCISLSHDKDRIDAHADNPNGNDLSGNSVEGNINQGTTSQASSNC